MQKKSLSIAAKKNVPVKRPPAKVKALTVRRREKRPPRLNLRV